MPGKGSNYSGYYYESLRDEALRCAVNHYRTCPYPRTAPGRKGCRTPGFVSKRVVNTASRIDIQLTITDLIGQAQHKYTEEEHKVIDSCSRKSQQASGMLSLLRKYTGLL